MASLPSSSGGIAVAITLVILIIVGFTAIMLTVLSRRRQEQQHCESFQEEDIGTGNMSHVQAHSTLQSPSISMARSSLSVSFPTPSSVAESKNTIAMMKYLGQRSKSLDTFPSLESVLKKYKQEDRQMMRHEDNVEIPTPVEDDLGEPGPAVPSERRGSSITV